MKLTLKVRKRDEWLIKELKRVVEVKHELGFPTTLDLELVKHARLGFTGETIDDLEGRGRRAGIRATEETLSSVYTRLEEAFRGGADVLSTVDAILQERGCDDADNA